MLSRFHNIFLIIVLIVCPQRAYSAYHELLVDIEVCELNLAYEINHALKREERAQKTAEMAELCAQKAILLMRAGDTEIALKYCRLSATHFEDADRYNNPLQ